MTSRHVGRDADPDRLPEDGSAPKMGLLALVLSAGIVAVGAVALAGVWRQAAPKPAAVAPAKVHEESCRAPVKVGETLSIFFRHDGERVRFRCINSNDWNVTPPAPSKQGHAL